MCLVIQHSIAYMYFIVRGVFFSVLHKGAFYNPPPKFNSKPFFSEKKKCYGNYFPTFLCVFLLFLVDPEELEFRKVA